MNPTNELERMAQTIRRLEARLQALELLTSGKAESIALRCGESAILMKKTGIEITSGQITIKASGDISLKAAKNVDIKGSKILNN